jgi:hypothetical protein
MAIKPKQIMDGVVGAMRGAVDRGVGLAGKLRNGERGAPPTTPATPAAKTTPARARRVSGGPATVGAAKPGKPRGPKSATAPKSTTAPKSKPASKPKPAADQTPVRRAE